MSVLGSFIKFLESKGLVEFDIVGDSDECFVNRVKLQKYVYIAQRFGLELPYKHSIYLYGPYSKTLKDDYYRMAENPDLYEAAQADLPSEFDQDGFLKAVRNDARWLEIATTLMERNKEIPVHDELVENVRPIKHWATRERIEEVLNDLERHNLVKRVAD